MTGETASLRVWLSKVLSDPAIKYAWGIYLAMRVAISLLAALILWLLNPPTTPDPLLRPYQGVEPIIGGWAELVFGIWQRFDTLWYLKIATQGYSPALGDIHFPPLYPVLIRAVGTLLLGNYLLAALLISNVAYFLGLLYFFRLVAQEFDTDVAKRSILYLAIFPTAFFFLAGYAESLFLLFAVASFHQMRRGSWLWAGFWGFLATLTRLQGLVLIFPLLYEYLKRRSLRRLGRDGLALTLIPTSLAIYLGLRVLVGGTPFLPTAEPTLYAHLAPPWENVLYSLHTLVSGRFHQADLFNFLSLCLFATIIILSWRALPLSYNIYMVAGLVLLTLRVVETQPLNSLSRYVLGLFPAFIFLGIAGRRPMVNRLIVYPSLALLIYLCGQFAIWGWVA